MTAEEAENMLEECAAKIGEHFEAVQIMATWTEAGICRHAKRGVGNWYARMGMAHEFIETNKADDQACLIAEKLTPPNDEGDDWKAQK
jgi:hypothetical protein